MITSNIHLVKFSKVTVVRYIFITAAEVSTGLHSLTSSKGRHRPNAITQREGIFLFSKVKKTVNGKKFCKICRPNSLNCSYVSESLGKVEKY